MQEVKNTTKAGKAIINSWENRNYDGIYDAYNRPSYAKVNAFNAINDRAIASEGYQHDLSVCGANSSFFSTVYSVVVDGVRWIIKDTPSATYKVQYNEGV